MAVLSNDDRGFLRGFFERALQLHADGVVTTESAVGYLVLAVDAIDRQDADEILYMRGALDDAWREDDG